MMKHLYFIFSVGLAIVLSAGTIHSQSFTRSDSLRGMITPERAWWDLTHYHLNVEFLPEEKSMRGFNDISYIVLDTGSVLQVDLQDPLKIRYVLHEGDTLDYTSEGHAHLIQLKGDQIPGSRHTLRVYYGGVPKEAERAPWDAVMTWTRDQSGHHFIATSCQGEGASMWWPCKDHMYDEVDSMKISITVPADLTAVSNGRLLSIDSTEQSKKTYHWAVINPINNYGVNANIGHYISWKDTFPGENGHLNVTYWALEEDKEKAKDYFPDQVHKTLEAFEHWFGPYPFYEDGYQLVQVPYLGMEHQSSITYGNEFKHGYLGYDLSGTGWGQTFDYIIVHESGHEWFANNITYKDMADLWIHEGFTMYSEGLFVEYIHGKDAGLEYIRGVRRAITNRRPLIAPYGVNAEPDGDVYHKGANVLNTLRTIVDNDSLWRAMLRGLNSEFYHETVTSSDIETYISEFLEIKLNSFFDQYLRHAALPTLEWKFKEDQLFVKWTKCIDTFDMPVDILSDSTTIRIYPTAEWQRVDWTEQVLPVVDPNYLIDIEADRE